MSRDYIDLDRTFYPVQEGERANAIWFSLAGRGEMRWEDLLGYWRVVILAEGGSGKSEELKNTALKEAARGRQVFFAPLLSVAQRGLPAGIEQGGDKFTQWKASDEPAWLFLDSVDEAKGERVRMADAFRTIARDIEGAASRLHIILSGRFTEWEPQGDLALFERELAWRAPKVQTEVSEDRDALLLEAVSGQTRRKRGATDEGDDDRTTPLVVGMSPLSEKQVRTYSASRNVTDVEAFLEAINDGNLSTFMRRPVDLDWLVEHWKRERGFARLEVMLEANLRQRLKEPDPHRRRTGLLSEEHGMQALERIGAALVMGRSEEILVPDHHAQPGSRTKSLSLEDLLVDWPDTARVDLLNRPIFDPAREGYVRLHNDNEGEVRAFLAARWLHRLTRRGHLADATLMRLVFATQYEVELVKPSMRSTAAWLSLWNAAVRERVLRVDPRLLMDAGDAAGLPRASRELALERWTQEAQGARHIDMPDRRALARFIQPDLAPKLRALWRMYQGEPAARSFLLFAILAGRLSSCADLAEEAATGAFPDEESRSYGTMALLVVGDDAALRRLAQFVHAHAKAESADVVWKVAEKVYPTHLTDAQLVDIMRDTHRVNTRQVERFEYVAPTLAAALHEPERVERVLKGVLALAKSMRPPRGSPRTQENRDHFVATIEAFAERLLQLSPATEAPALAIDAAIDANYERRYRPLPSREEVDLYARLNETPERREASLWHAAARFPSTRHGQAIDDVFMLQHHGFAPDLQASDAPWLLKAARTRKRPAERTLAANALMRLSVSDGKPGGPWLEALKSIEKDDEVIAKAVREWTTPREPTPEDLEHQREMARLTERNDREEKARSASWLRRAEEIRAKPTMLRLPPGAAKGEISSALYDVHQILSSAIHADNRYAVTSVDALRPILGDVVAEVARDAFIDYWRHWTPDIRSERVPPGMQGLSKRDVVGLAGVSLEAAHVSDWTRKLSPTEAENAARYALLELNGFPDWMEPLVRAHSASVRKVLLRALAPELAADYKGERDLLRKLSRAPAGVLDLVTPLLMEVVKIGELQGIPLMTVLDALADTPSCAPSLILLLKEKVSQTADVATLAPYLAALFRVSAADATAALKSALKSKRSHERAQLMQAVLPRMFDDGRSYRAATNLDLVPTEDLEAMVHLAYAHIRVADDLERSGVYSPTPRDDAQQARGRLLGALLNRPGPYTFYATARLQAAGGRLGLPLPNLASMAYTRAAYDAETSPWSPRQVYEFEKDTLTLPRTSEDLQRVAMGVFEDLQQRWTTGDNSIDTHVARLSDEKAIQQWVTEIVTLYAGKAFIIDRESHIHDEKEPDLRLTARETSARSPIEIKRSTWTLEELEAAIEKQLIGRYLKNPDYRHGILLLVHQKSRPRGWRGPGGKTLNFSQVVAHLRDLAATIAAATPTAAQVEVAVLDVSGPRKRLDKGIGKTKRRR